MDHQGTAAVSGRLIIRSNRQQANFDLFETPVNAPDESQWQAMLAGDDRHYLMGHVAFAQATVVCLRIDGLDQIQIIDEAGTHQIDFPEPAYSLDLGTNPTYDTDTLRIAYTSMVTPHTVYDYNWRQGKLTSLKVQEIPAAMTPETT